MDYSSQLKPFSCPIHPNESIQRVSLDNSIPQTVYCFECIFKLDKFEKSILIDINNLVQTLGKELSKAQSTIETDAPQYVLDLIENREAYEKNFTKNINNQKAKIEQNFQKILANTATTIENARDAILSKLDSQLIFFKKNYETYIEMINSNFKSRLGRSEKLSEQTLITELNNCQTSIDLTIKIKGYACDIEQNEEISKLIHDEREAISLKRLKSISEKMQAIMKEPVFCYGASDLEEIIYLNSYKRSLKNMIAALSDLRNPVSFIRQNNTSQLLQDSDLPFIRKVVKQDKKVSFRQMKCVLASDELFSIDSLREIWYTKPYLIFLARAKLSQNIFGVYKEHTGTNTKTIVFDLKRKFLADDSIPNPQINIENSSYFRVSSMLCIAPPDSDSYNGILNFYCSVSQESHFTPEEGQEIQNGGFIVEMVEILEVEFEGRPKIEPIKMSQVVYEPDTEYLADFGHFEMHENYQNIIENNADWT